VSQRMGKMAVLSSTVAPRLARAGVVRVLQA
jgi:hypothetical protein